MTQEMVDQIKNDPDFIQLVQKRSKFAWTLTAVMLTIYFGFVLTIAFDPSILGAPLLAGSITTVGIPVGVGVIVSAFILTGIYIRRANGEFDALSTKIKQNAKAHQ